jgi:hypothetical protein
VHPTRVAANSSAFDIRIGFILFDRCSIAPAKEHHHPFANDPLIGLKGT